VYADEKLEKSSSIPVEANS